MHLQASIRKWNPFSNVTCSMNFPIHFTILLSLTVVIRSYSQDFKKIVIGENERIRLPKEYVYTFENHLAVNPKNPDHLVGTILTTCPDTVKNCLNTLIVSKDGGKTWQSSSTPAGADPWCAVLADGSIVISYIYGGNYILGLKSFTDNGQSWSSELLFGSGYDHDLLLVDDSSGPFSGSVYLLATQSLRPDDPDPFLLISRSSNGKTFEHRNYFYPLKNVDLNAKSPVIFSDGVLAIPFAVRGQYLQGENKPVPFDQSTNWLVTSDDGGETFSQPKFITSVTGRGHHVLAVNKSKKWANKLYFISNGPQQKGIYCTMSDDRGESWTKSKRIDKNSSNLYNIVGAVAINQVDGSIGVIYMEREDEGTEQCYNVYFTVSIDGGSTFTEPKKVNSQRSCPDKKQGWFVGAWPQGGDYCSLVARPNGDFLAMWSDSRSGFFKLYKAEISFK